MPTTKTREIAVGGKHNIIIRYEPSHTVASMQEYNDNIHNVVDSVTYGDNIIGWKTLIASGKSATTSLSGRRHYYSGQSTKPLYVYRDYKFGPDDFSIERTGDLWQIQMPGDPTLSTSLATNLALTKWVSRATEAQHALQGLVSFGELGQTLRMIRSPFKSLYKGLVGFLNGTYSRHRRPRGSKRPSPARVHQVAADSWLEFAFGINPTVSDVFGGIEAYNRIVSQRPLYQRVSAVGRDSRITSISRFTRDWTPWNITQVNELREEASCRFTGMVGLRNRDTVANHFGLSWDQVAPALWELIPHSFLADYFFNIGDIIAAASFDSSEIAWLCRTIRVSAINRVVSVNVMQTTNSAYNDSPDSTGPRFDLPTATRTLIDRVDYTAGSLIPDFRFQIPGLSLKWLNMTALATSHTRRSRWAYTH